MDETLSKLPWELVQHIFSFLDLASLASSCLVAKGWHRIGRRKELWRCFQRTVLFLRYRKSSLDIFSTETQALDSFPDTTWYIDYRSEMRAVFHKGALYYLGYPRATRSIPSASLMRVNLPTVKKDRVAFKQLAQYPTCEGLGMVADGDFIYIFGGRPVERSKYCVRKYSISKDYWIPVETNCRLDMACFSTIQYNRSVFLIGGWSTTGDLYSPPEFSDVSNMNLPRVNAAATLYEGCIYVFGGESSSSSFERYDIRQDKWEIFESPQVIQERHAVVIHSVPDAIFLLGKQWPGKVFHPSDNSWSDISAIFDKWPRMDDVKVALALSFPFHITFE